MDITSSCVNVDQVITLSYYTLPLASRPEIKEVNNPLCEYFAADPVVWAEEES